MKSTFSPQNPAISTKMYFLMMKNQKELLIRSIEIVGEASKNIPEDFKQQYPEFDD